MYTLTSKTIKISILLLLSLLFLQFVSFDAYAANVQFSKGNGTKESPYEIISVEQFMEIANHMDKHFILAKDLDFINYKKAYNPIGSYQEDNFSKSFKGSFDGNSHIIKNIVIDASDKDNIGIFGAATGDEKNQVIIKNLTIENAKITGKDNVAVLLGYAYEHVLIDNVRLIGSNSIKGVDSVAGIIGKTEKSNVLKNSSSICTIVGDEGLGGIIGFVSQDSSIINCFTESEITGAGHIGGFAGRVYGSIEQSSAHAKVLGEGYDHDAAGFAGTLFNSGKIRDCYSYGTVEGFLNVGGLVARTLNYYPEGVTPPNPIPSPSITGSYSLSDVKGVSQVGGLVGYVKENTVIDKCYASGTVKLLKDDHAPDETEQGYHGGGLVGKIDITSKVLNSKSSGNVIGEEGIAGLIGYLGESSIVSKSYSTGNVTGIGHIGGLVGRCYGQVNECYSNSDVTLQGSEHDAGGIVGTLFNKGSIINSYSTGEISGHENIGGIAGRVMVYYNEGDAPSILPNPKVENCMSYSQVSGDENVGGIVGFAKVNSTISLNTSLSFPKAKNPQTVGKITGMTEAGAKIEDNK